MAKYNSGFYYNRRGNEYGAVYNSNVYILVLHLNELLRVDDKISENLAKMILFEQNNVLDEIVLTALYTKHDMEYLTIKDDDIKVSLLFFMAEEIGIKDELTDLIVLSYLHDDIKVVEETKMLAEILTRDNINVKDITDVHAFLNQLDEFGLVDLKASLEILISTHDKFGLTDREPRTAVSDFVIGAADNVDRAYDWLIPFGLKIDWDKTKIQVMPEAELTKIQMPGIDGSIIEDSVYKDRLFEIVAYSQDGLSIAQKEELKDKITRVLDATKHQDKKLTVQAADTSFDVRYEGQAEIVDGPSYVKATIPLRTPPYGSSIFETELNGAGLVDNTAGNAPLRVKHIITGAITNPTFSLGTITYTYKGFIPIDNQLIIDHDMMSCYIIDNKGKKTNALANLVGEFQAIPAGESVVLNTTTATASHLKTEWKIKVL